MFRSNAGLSLAIGVFAPLPLLVVFNAVSAGASVIGPVSWRSGLTAVFLMALGLVLWPPIQPALFAMGFAGACPLWFTLLAGTARSSNLFGLGVIIVAVAGLMVAIAAAGIGTALRRWRMPPWIPVVPLIAAVVLLIATGAIQSGESDVQLSEFSRFVERLDAADQSYAAGPPSRGFTCNGPDLPSITDIDWRADYNLGGTEKNQGSYAGYWVILRCEPVWRPSFYTVTAMPSSGSGRW